MRSSIYLFAALALTLSGCSKDKAAKESAAAETEKAGGAASDKAGFHKPVAAGLTKAGFKVGAFEQAAARPYEATACTRGEVDKLDVLLCRYASADDAQKARAKLEQFVAGAVSGAVRSAGPTALAVADRAKVDLQGKRINKLLKAFAKLPVGS